MSLLIVGLIVFLGIHSIRIVAPSLRDKLRADWGENRYKGFYSLVSFIGLALVVWGYALARPESAHLWISEAWTRWITAATTLVAFAFFAAASVPRNRIKAWVRHPMVIGVMIWAAGHLAVNGRSAELLLFGAFFIWALFSLISALARDRATGDKPEPGGTAGDVKVVVSAVVIWALFGGLAHKWLIGVPAFY